MSLGTELHNLQERQRRELAFMRARMTSIADSFEHEASPAQWIREHPYVATAGAAMIGLVAAQLPGRSAPRLPQASAPPPAPAAPAPAAPAPAAPAPAPSSFAGDLLALVMNLAQQFIQPQRDDDPACVTSGDAGAIAGPDFPQCFRRAAERPSTNPR
jgi:hypothetical protein